jgi:hypothetical protein
VLLQEAEDLCFFHHVIIVAAIRGKGTAYRRESMACATSPTRIPRTITGAKFPRTLKRT